MSESTLEFTHLDAGARVRLLDGEGSRIEREEWRAHVEGCGRCAGDVEREARLLRAVSREIARLELPAGFPRPTLAAPQPAQRSAWRTGWLRAAAVVAVMAAVFGTVEPLRAWVAERWEAVAAAVLGTEAPAPAAPEAQPTRLWFEAAPTLRVELSAAQAGGTLTLRRTGEERGLLELHGPDAGAPLLADGRLRIETRAGSAASYLVGVPAAVREVRVRVGDGPERRIDAAQLAGPWVLELGGGDGAEPR